MLGTRPNIAYVVMCMLQFCANPLQEYLCRALYIIQYLGSTKNFTLCYDGANHDSFLGYTNSDRTANPDDWKSITGYVLFLANSPVSWLTRQQKTVALSSTEAEYMAMSDTAQQISWIKSLLGEIHFSIPKAPLYCDNQGVIFLAPRNSILNILGYTITISMNAWKKEIKSISSIFQWKNRLLISSPRIYLLSSLKTFTEASI